MLIVLMNRHHEFSNVQQKPNQMTLIRPFPKTPDIPNVAEFGRTQLLCKMQGFCEEISILKGRRVIYQNERQCFETNFVTKFEVFRDRADGTLCRVFDITS